MKASLHASGASAARSLDLSDYDAVLFDLDGVLTDTARIHEAAWAAVFSEFFQHVDQASGDGKKVAPFTAADYRRLVDGESRIDGVHNVLADRQLSLPEGDATDGGGMSTAWALATAKDLRYLELIRKDGVGAFPSSISMVRSLKAAGLLVGVVSASRHCLDVLAAAGVVDLFDTVVDGWVASAMKLPGKPNPATYFEAASRLGVAPARAVVVEDAIAGVEAGRNGDFGLVIGVNCSGIADALAASGADFVVGDLGQVKLRGAAQAPWNIDLSDTVPGSTSQSALGRRESLGALANGYLGTRAARVWRAAEEKDYPGTYIAGVYDRLTSVIDGVSVEHESIVNVPDWLRFTFSADGGPWLGESGVTVSNHSVRLDLRRGVLISRWVAVDPAGHRTSITEQRIVSMAEPHLVGLNFSIVAENWSGELRIRLALDADVSNSQTVEGRILANRHFGGAVDSGEDPPKVVWLASRTVQSGIVVAEAARATVRTGVETSRKVVRGPISVGQEVCTQIVRTGRIEVEKLVAIFTSHDRAISEPLSAARAAVAAAPDFGTFAADHERSWFRLWQRGRMVVGLSRDANGTGQAEGPTFGGEDAISSDVVHLQLFHILQVASPNVVDLDVGIPARGLAGEGYLGHIFWDELFVFPVLNFRFPDVARALLQYRQRRLGAARSAASVAGYRGAMYPWQSGSDGRDETPRSLFNDRTQKWIADDSYHQRHIGLAVAYELWQHWESTGDREYLYDAGAEVFLETARFFASLATYDDALAAWRIRGVMGPDEFHDAYPLAHDGGVDDNAYSNVMTAWLLRRAADLVALIRAEGREDVLDRIHLGDVEVDGWGELTTGLFVPFHDGVISQFAGYELLAALDLDAYRRRYGNIGRLDLILDAEGDSVRNYQVAKQADVLMLFYLLSAEELRDVLAGLGHDLDSEVILRTIRYYSDRAVHGSSLSAVVHAWVQARTDRAGSWAQFRRALAMDYADLQGGSTVEGIHLGAMAGSVDLLQRCYTGLEVRDGALWLNPELPDELESLQFGLTYRGHWVDIEIDHVSVAITAGPGQAPPAYVVLSGRRRTLKPGQRIEHRLG